MKMKMNMVEYASNYRAFLESRRFVVDPNEEEVMSWVYMNSLVIAASQGKSLELTVGNQSIRSDRLDALEPVLFEYAVSEGYFDNKSSSSLSAVREFGAAEKLVNYLNEKYNSDGLAFFMRDNHELMVYFRDALTPSFVDEATDYISPVDLKMCTDYNEMVNRLVYLDAI